MALRWGVVATVKEDAGIIKTFVAHYLDAGASEIFLYFDDPEDAAAGVVAGVEGVTAVRCGDAHWKGTRPATHQARQKVNANLAYRLSRADWLIHLDADELLYCETPTAGRLAELDDGARVARCLPAEAMTPARPEPGVTIFRMALPNSPKGERIGEAVYGEVYPLLEYGLLSHTAGKFFVRTGLPAATLTIHGPMVSGKRDLGVDLDGVILLHFHGHDEDAWIASVERRLTRGAYQAKFHDLKRNAGKVDGKGRAEYLQHLMDTEGEEGLRRFFRQVCVFDHQKRTLKRADALLKLELGLDEKVAARFPEG